VGSNRQLGEVGTEFVGYAEDTVELRSTGQPRAAVPTQASLAFLETEPLIDREGGRLACGDVAFGEVADYGEFEHFALQGLYYEDDPNRKERERDHHGDQQD